LIVAAWMCPCVPAIVNAISGESMPALYEKLSQPLKTIFSPVVAGVLTLVIAIMVPAALGGVFAWVARRQSRGTMGRVAGIARFFARFALCFNVTILAGIVIAMAVWPIIVR
jgi:hypothetical protein